MSSVSYLFVFSYYITLVNINSLALTSEWKGTLVLQKKVFGHLDIIQHVILGQKNVHQAIVATSNRYKNFLVFFPLKRETYVIHFLRMIT